MYDNDDSRSNNSNNTTHPFTNRFADNVHITISLEASIQSFRKGENREELVD
jgi:hypothetical protein